MIDPVRGGHGPLEFMSEAHRFNMAGHALVGCASAVASGGSCGAGALSAGAGSFASPLMAGWSFTAKLVTTSVIGGVASVAGGDKFGNGALTAAFGYLFNETANEIGRAGEVLHERLMQARGATIIGSQLEFYEVDANGKRVYRADGTLSRGRMDALVQEGRFVYSDEVKNGRYADMNANQRSLLRAIAEGRIVFYGQNATEAGIAGKSMSELLANRSWGGFRLWGFGGSRAPSRLYNRVIGGRLD